MKKFLTLSLICMLAFGAPVLHVSASTLDDVVNGQTQQVEQTQTEQNSTESSNNDASNIMNNGVYVDELKQATDLSEMSEGASKVNEGISKVASFIVQVLSYFITAFLVVRIVIDICYITIPFTRSFLANGYQGNAQAGVGMADGGGMQGGMGMGGMGGMGSPMGGMGMGGMSGMGMGGMGMGGYGRGRYGMGGGMGMGGMQGGMMGQQGMQGAGANPILGRVQWVSSAALNAVAAESSVGMDGKPDNPLKVYFKDMIVVLILTPILLVLAITGALTDLGFLLGDLLANALSSVGNMI